MPTIFHAFTQLEHQEIVMMLNALTILQVNATLLEALTFHLGLEMQSLKEMIIVVLEYVMFSAAIAKKTLILMELPIVLALLMLKPATEIIFLLTLH